MATRPSESKPRRIRRLPDDARREILDAAEALLAEHPFRELSVDDLMTRTGMTRSSFYHYFRSLDEVAIALMRRVQGEMMEATAPWLRVDYDGDRAVGLEQGIRRRADVLAPHGLLPSATHQPSSRYEAVEHEWRDAELEHWIS